MSVKNAVAVPAREVQAKKAGSPVPRVIFSLSLLTLYIAVLAALFYLTRNLAFSPHPDYPPTKGWDF